MRSKYGQNKVNEDLTVATVVVVREIMVVVAVGIQIAEVVTGVLLTSQRCLVQ